MAERAAGITDLATLTARLTRTRAAVRAAIVVERLWPLLVPALVVLALFLSFAWFGLFRLVPEWGRYAALVAAGLALLAALVPLVAFRRPGAAEVDRRIEAANRLTHRPVTTQTDRPSGSGDPFAAALWREHQRRMADRLGGVRGDLPRTRLPEHDPWGLRAAAVLLLIVAFAFSLGPLGGRIGDAFRAHATDEVVPARIDAWVTPPAYTGKAPIFLTADANRALDAFTVPEGSEVAVRVTGGSGDESLAFLDADGNSRAIEPSTGADGSGRAAIAGARQFAATLDADGVVALSRGEEALDRWAFAVTPDAPPVIRLTEEPSRAVNGSLKLRYEVEDDYGASAAVGEFVLEQAPGEDARPLYQAPEMPLTLPRRNGRDIAAETTRDLTEHVWAGHRVKMRLKVTDAAGQEGLSEEKIFVLPERIFTNPLALAVVEHRQIFSLDANRKPDVLDLIDAITLRPDDTFENLSHYLGIMTGRTRLDIAESDETLREAADYMWDMALAIEDGDLTAAEKRLRQAQEALRQALENGASDEEIEELMAELREAMREYLREFAERAMQNPDMAQQMPQMPQDGQEMRQSDLERMMDQIEELAKSGAREQAQELLSQLEEMMNNLQAGRQQQGGGEQSEMRQQMDRLGEIMRRQQEMMNETHRLDQMQRGQRQRGQQGEQGEDQQGQQGQGQNRQGQGMTAEEFAEAMRRLQEGQGELEGELGSLMQGLEGLGIQPGEGFGEAGEAMGEAEQALGDSEGERAVGEQGRALEALRRGAQDMMNQMQQAMQGDRGGSEQGGRQQNADRDPLGRPRATTGPDFGDTVEVPDEIDTQRARQILEAIRRRLGDALSPELERSYLERLLELR